MPEPTEGGRGRARTAVLVLDRSGSFHEFVRKVGIPEGYDVLHATSVREAVATGRREQIGVALVDVCLPGGGLLGDAESLTRARIGAPFIVVSGCPPLDAAARVLYPEAAAFLQRPCKPDELVRKISGILSSGRSGVSQDDHGNPFHGLVGTSAGMRRVIGQIQSVAPTDSTVLITGETGTGKELVAKAIHECSSRSSRPYVVVDTLALAEGVLESELFGHARGAFTGAVRSKTGLIESADGGSVFLDEIGDVSSPIQGRLLRLVQEKEIRRVGAVEPKKVDIRFIAATQWSLEEAVKTGRLREDLYYRLSVYNIDIPPLRKRPEDIPLLIDHFLREEGGSEGSVSAASGLAAEMLRCYDWPGNVRELLAVVESARIDADGSYLSAGDLPERVRIAWREKVFSASGGEHEGPAPRRVVERALKETDGHREDAAGLLGVSRTTLWRWMKRHDL